MTIDDFEMWWKEAIVKFPHLTEQDKLVSKAAWFAAVSHEQKTAKKPLTEGHMLQAKKADNDKRPIKAPPGPTVEINLKDLESSLVEFIDAGKLTSPGEWSIRYQNWPDGDFFVESSKQSGKAYGIEIMDDEYYPTKNADAEFLVIAKKLSNLLEKKND